MADAPHPAPSLASHHRPKNAANLPIPQAPGQGRATPPQSLHLMNKPGLVRLAILEPSGRISFIKRDD